MSAWKTILAVAIITFAVKTYILNGTGKFETFKKQHTKAQLEKNCPVAASQRFFQCIQADFDTFISDSNDMDSLEMLAFVREITKIDQSLEVSYEGKVQSQINFLTTSKFIFINKDTSPTHQKGHGAIIESLKLQITQSDLPDDKKQMFQSELDELRI
jgi:hypothetical protein